MNQHRNVLFELTLKLGWNLRRFAFSCLFFIPCWLNAGTNDGGISIYRIKQGHADAIRQAVDQHRVDLIPALKEAAANEDRGGRPNRIATIALAKLGVKEAYDEIVADFTTTNTVVYRYYLKDLASWAMWLSPAELASEAEWKAKGAALEEFIRLKDESTVKYIGPWLLTTNWIVSPMSPQGGTSLTDVAAAVLRKMHFDGLPLPEIPLPTERNPRKAWREWWEKHKDYYEKLDYGKPAPATKP